MTTSIRHLPDARQPTQQRSVQAGFTMIEALVAIFVVAIGLLGLSFLQAQGMKFNNSAYARTQSTFSAYDITDRIRTNPAAALAGLYDATAAPGSFTDCDTTTCTSTEMAAFDLARWYAQMQDEFGGTGTVAWDTVNGYTITVTWTERAVRANDNTADSDLVTPRTQMWEIKI